MTGVILQRHVRYTEIGTHVLRTPVLPNEALHAHDVYECLERPSGALPREVMSPDRGGFLSDTENWLSLLKYYVLRCTDYSGVSSKIVSFLVQSKITYPPLHERVEIGFLPPARMLDERMWRLPPGRG